MQNAAEACCQPLNVPLRSLKRSSPCEVRAAEIGVDDAVAVATGLVAATAVAVATGVAEANRRQTRCARARCCRKRSNGWPRRHWETTARRRLLGCPRHW